MVPQPVNKKPQTISNQRNDCIPGGCENIGGGDMGGLPTAFASSRADGGGGPVVKCDIDDERKIKSEL